MAFGWDVDDDIFDEDEDELDDAHPFGDDEDSVRDEDSFGGKDKEDDPFGDDKKNKDKNKDKGQSGGSKSSGQGGQTGKEKPEKSLKDMTPEEKEEMREKRREEERKQKEEEERKKKEEEARNGTDPSAMKSDAKSNNMPEMILPIPCPVCKKKSLFADPYTPIGRRVAFTIACAFVGMVNADSALSVVHFRCMNKHCKSYWGKTGDYFLLKPTGKIEKKTSIFHISR